MGLESIIFELSVIVVGAAVLGTLFLYAKQPVIIAYIAIGIIVGPSGLSLIKKTGHIEQISHIGVILLLFLIGLNMQPNKLVKLFKKTSILTFSTAAVFMVVFFLCARVIGFGVYGSLVFGASMMFSSTIVGLKLIPTTTLHHKRTGEMMTSILLLQDVLAILVILFITGEKSDNILLTFGMLTAKFTLLCLLSFVGVRFIMTPLLTKFDIVQEYTFLATLAWCLLWAEVAYILGLSYEIGAFLAGISIASCRVAIVIAEHLKPLREFFLILFFFAIGSKLDFNIDPILILAAVSFGALLVPFKILIFRIAFSKSAESKGLQRELSARLGQSSEFSLLVAFSALSMGILTDQEAMVIQIATIVTFSISTYWVVLRYPTPIAGNAALLKD